MIYRIVFAVLVVLTFWWMFRLGAGEREFERSQQALQQVTSWRQEARAGAQDSEQAEIMCPDRGHWVRHVTSDSKDGIKKHWTVESVEIGSRSYSRSSLGTPTEPSQKGPEDVPTVTAQCAKLMRGEYLYPMPNYNHLIEHTKIVKGAIDTVQGLKCQEWTTVQVIPGRFSPAQPLDNSQVCIGLNDHLPRRIKYANAEYIFYDWNTAIQIEGLKGSQAARP